MRISSRGVLALGLLCFGAVASCGSGDEGSSNPGSGASSGTGASAGSGATAGSGASAGAAGSGASAGTGGTGGGTGGTGATAGTGGTGAVPGATDANLKVALFGDQGSGTNPRAVYKVALDEGADFIVALGDFDYKDDPALWETDMNAVIGPEYPLFGVVGNHDTAAWSGYQAILTKRMAKAVGAQCSGDVGNKQTCLYRGLRMIISGIGTMGNKAEHETFIQQSLEADTTSLWKLCIWHQNQNDMQLGSKGDAIGWKAFQLCQDHGGIVAMGHEHTYGRTLSMKDVGNTAGGHGAFGKPELMEVALGSTFSFYNGMGGTSLRDYEAAQHDDDTWWATYYTTNKYLKNGQLVTGFTAKHGVLFLVFNVDGDPSKAKGYFKNTAGEMIDEFTIVRN